MSGPLNRQPEGLSDLFQGKGTVLPPTTLSDHVQGTIDLLRFYADVATTQGLASGTALIADTSSASFNITSAMWTTNNSFDFAFGGAATVVPVGELWLVTEATINWAMSVAGHVADFALLSRSHVSASDNIEVITDSPILGYSSGVAGITRAGFRIATKPFYMLSGADLRYHCFGALVPAASITFNINVRIRRLLR